MLVVGRPRIPCPAEDGDRVTDERLDPSVTTERVPSGGDGTEPRHRVRLPRFIVQQPVGLGEVVKRGTTALGVRPCEGCQKRAAQLDRWVGLAPRR